MALLLGHVTGSKVKTLGAVPAVKMNSEMMAPGIVFTSRILYNSPVSTHSPQTLSAALNDLLELATIY